MAYEKKEKKNSTNDGTKVGFIASVLFTVAAGITAAFSGDPKTAVGVGAAATAVGLGMIYQEGAEENKKSTENKSSFFQQPKPEPSIMDNLKTGANLAFNKI